MGSSPSPGLPDWMERVRWERVGHQSSSEAEVTSMPRGQMEKVLQTPHLASLSQEKDLPPASQSKEKARPMDPLHLHSEKPECTAVPALAPFSPFVRSL